jgi:hypothetical protein
MWEKKGEHVVRRRGEFSLQITEWILMDLGSS